MLEVVARLPDALVVTDLTAFQQGCRARELERRCAEQATEPFALDRAPLWRARLFACAAGHHVLMWTLQHIICDGWSLVALTDELVRAYAAARRQAGGAGTAVPSGPGSTVPPPAGYLDYARWQRRHLAGTERQRLDAFWQAELAGASLDLPLPTDRHPPRRPSGRGAVRQFTLGPTECERLRRAARHLNSTLYAVALSAFASLLAELTGRDDLVIPISHANRTRTENEGVVGLLSDRVLVRTRLGGATGARDLVRRVGCAVFAALDHREMPLSVLVAGLPGSQRPAGHYPTVLFTLLDEPGERWDLGDLVVTVQPDSVDGAARMLLYCFMSISGGRLSGGFEYDSEVLAAATVAAWSDRFVALLTEVGRLAAGPGDRAPGGSGPGNGPASEPARQGPASIDGWVGFLDGPAASHQ